jgi:hypothetical protein
MHLKILFGESLFIFPLDGCDFWLKIVFLNIWCILVTNFLIPLHYFITQFQVPAQWHPGHVPAERCK